MYSGAKFNTLVADPPWRYNDNSPARRAANRKHYDDMSMDELYAMSPWILERTSDHCILFMWTTNSFLADGQAVALVKTWGFKPKAIHTWVKMAKNGNQRIGVGDYGRNSTEHFIVAVRGKPDIKRFHLAPAIPTAHLWPWQSKHSQKPPEFYKLVERVSTGPTLELFARKRREGWESHGDQLSDAIGT